MGLLFGHHGFYIRSLLLRLNPLFGGSAFRTFLCAASRWSSFVLIPFLAGLLFGLDGRKLLLVLRVLIPFLAGLLFGQTTRMESNGNESLNPLFGGSAFRTPFSFWAAKKSVLIPFLAGLLFGHPLRDAAGNPIGLNPLFGGSAFRTVLVHEAEVEGRS